VDARAAASLKVSFFGSFSAGYNVIGLDPDYRQTLVCGPERDHRWILSRTPALDTAIAQRPVGAASQHGFDTDERVRVNQSPLSSVRSVSAVAADRDNAMARGRKSDSGRVRQPDMPAESIGISARMRTPGLGYRPRGCDDARFPCDTRLRPSP
jgi:hypothetical protein